MIHIHVTSWTIGLILFFVSYFLYKNEGSKVPKILHMILRVVYLVIIATGGHMLANYLMDPGIVNKGPLIIKGVLGLIVISLMEMILIQRKKGQVRIASWIFFVIAFLLVLFYGYIVLR